MTVPVPVVVSVNVGLPKDVPWQGKTVHTGIWKQPVTGPVMVRRLNIDGDGQGDLAGHGGEQRAVFVYQLDSYRHWEQHFGRDDFVYGMFGENLTVDGLPDDEVCIGDRYRIGEAEFEVTQPRVTCYRVGMRVGEPQLPALLVSHHRPGFYLRVLTEGRIQAGDAIVKIADRATRRCSVADTDALLYLPGPDTGKLRAALRIPRAQPGLAGLVPRHAGRSGTGTGSCVARVPDIAGQQGGAGRRGGVLGLPGGRRRHRAAGRAGRAVPDPAGRRRRAAGPGAELFAVVGAGRRHLPDQRQAGAARHRQRLPEPGRAGLARSWRWPRPAASSSSTMSTGPVLLISAGIGVTPVLSMLYQLAAAGSEREVWWLYGARGPDEHPFAKEAHALLASLPHAREHIFYSAATPQERHRAHAASRPDHQGGARRAAHPGRRGDRLYLRAGLVHGRHARRAHRARRGPRAHPQRAVRRAGRHQPRAHRAAPPAAAPAAGAAGTGPQVTFARSGITTAFGDAWRSVLDLADACDVPTRWSCRTGVCHTCVTPLLSGDISYAPDPLELPADGQILICCARPSTDLVLDM